MADSAKNTDRELWREREGDYYADSIHVTESGGIGINCGGSVIVKPVREWHALAALSVPPEKASAVSGVNPIENCGFCGGTHYGSNSCPYRCRICGSDIRTGHTDTSCGLGRSFACGTPGSP